MKLTHRRKIVLALVAAIVIAGYVVLFVPFGLTVKDADRIRPDMTLAEVESVFGTAGIERVTGIYNWKLSDGVVFVVFRDDRACVGGVVDYPPWYRAVDSVRLKLGFPTSQPDARILFNSSPTFIYSQP